MANPKHRSLASSPHVLLSHERKEVRECLMLLIFKIWAEFPVMTRPCTCLAAFSRPQLCVSGRPPWLNITIKCHSTFLSRLNLSIEPVLRSLTHSHKLHATPHAIYVTTVTYGSWQHVCITIVIRPGSMTQSHALPLTLCCKFPLLTPIFLSLSFKVHLGVGRILLAVADTPFSWCFNAFSQKNSLEVRLNATCFPFLFAVSALNYCPIQFVCSVVVPSNVSLIFSTHF